MAQYIIETGLKKIYPFIKIVGEEGDKGLPSDFDFEKLDLDIFKNLTEKFEEFDLSGFNSKEYEFSDACVFIDPLDGTRGFVKGKLEIVTTLITLCTDSVPQVGIVGQGFLNGNDSFEPRTVVGCRDIPFVVQLRDLGYYEHEIEEVFQPFEDFDEEGKT